MNIKDCNLELLIDLINNDSLTNNDIDIINKIIFGIDIVDKKTDIIITLGNPNINDRIDKCLYLSKKYTDSLIILSGGVLVPNTLYTESKLMEKYLIENNIDIKRIICENKSTDTIENGKYVIGIINDLKTNKEISVSLVTSSYHIRRSLMIFNTLKNNNRIHINPFYSIDSECNNDNWYKSLNGKKKIINELKMINYLLNEGYESFDF